MKDKELRIYEILYGGICMSLPIFLCPGKLSLWRLLLPMAAAFCLYEAALRRKSILLYLLIWIAFGAAAFEAGRDLIEKACLTGGIIFGGAACFYGRWKGDYLFLGGPALPMLAVPAVAYLIAHVEKWTISKAGCVFLRRWSFSYRSSAETGSGFWFTLKRMKRCTVFRNGVWKKETVMS